MTTSEPRKQTRWDVPAHAGRVVAMTIYDDILFIACEYRVYVQVDGLLQPLQFYDE